MKIFIIEITKNLELIKFNIAYKINNLELKLYK